MDKSKKNKNNERCSKKNLNKNIKKKLHLVWDRSDRDG